MRPEEFTEAGLGLVTQPIFARFREAHVVLGGDYGDDVLSGTRCPTRAAEGGDGDDEEQNLDEDNMNNAWFEELMGSTEFQVQREGAGEVVEVTVTDDAGRMRRGVFPCWSGRGPLGTDEGMGLGNAAMDVDLGEEDDGEVRQYEKRRGEEEQWAGYAHDEMVCERCLARQRVARQLERERARERRDYEHCFASVGLGMDGQDGDRDMADEEGDDDDDDASSDTSSYDVSLDEWDPIYEATVDDDGNIYQALPRSHDRARLANGKCDGIKEIFLFGEVFRLYYILLLSSSNIHTTIDRQTPRRCLPALYLLRPCPRLGWTHWDLEKAWELTGRK